MPKYEYACKGCGRHLEVTQKFTDPALTECPNCSGPLRKVFGAVGISFKGSGFYKTDSRNSGAKPSGDKGDKGSGESSGDKATTAESSGGESASTSSSEGPKNTEASGSDNTKTASSPASD